MKTDYELFWGVGDTFCCVVQNATICIHLMHGLMYNKGKTQDSHRLQNDRCINLRDLGVGGWVSMCFLPPLCSGIIRNRSKQNISTLPRSLRSRYSAASINICTIPIAAIFNNNTDNLTIRWWGIPWLFTTCFCFRSDRWLACSTLRWLAAPSLIIVFLWGVPPAALCHTGYLKVKGHQYSTDHF